MRDTLLQITHWQVLAMVSLLSIATHNHNNQANQAKFHLCFLHTATCILVKDPLRETRDDFWVNNRKVWERRRRRRERTEVYAWTFFRVSFVKGGAADHAS